MPTVPGQVTYLPQPSRPSESDLLMAAATMHSLGRLTFAERAMPAEDAIASGTFDPAGQNFTDFKSTKRKDFK